MTRTMTRNNEHFRRALKRLPLGVASNFRYWGEERTIYVKQGRGARIVDLDDNVYIDYRLGYGGIITLTYICSLSLAYPLGSLVDRLGAMRMAIFAMILYATSCSAHVKPIAPPTWLPTPARTTTPCLSTAIHR